MIINELYGAIDYVNSLLILDSLPVSLSLKKKLMEKMEKELEEIDTNKQTGLISLVEKSLELGYHIKDKDRSKLGQFIRLQGIEPIERKKRLINGKVIMVNVYENCLGLEQAILAFFS